MANQQTIDKILNKQFKKTAFAGYDTTDVDSFFDTVIDYLKANDSAVEEYKNQLNKLVNDNRELTDKIKQLNQIIAQKTHIILQYEHEGYGNVMMNKRLAEAEQKIKNLEKANNNGK